MPLQITLDRNIIIGLEENRSFAPDVRKLVELHDCGAVVVRLIGINASEKNKDGSYPNSISEFQKKIQRIGLGSLELLKPMGYWGITFWDHCVWADDVGELMQKLEEQLHIILFPEIEYSYANYCKQKGITPEEDFIDAKWRNRKCDVLTIWSHIFHSQDVFVTDDDNFLKASKKPELIRLGAKAIFRPGEALNFVLAQ